MKAGKENTNYRHGHSSATESSPTYNSWRAMIERCTNRNHQYWHNYGGRGVKVCKRWLKFENFLADMGERPVGMTLDRFPNATGNYEPGNCRWATRREQQRNRPDNHLVQCYSGPNGCKPVIEWSEISGTKYRTILYRLSKHWPPREAVFGRGTK